MSSKQKIDESITYLISRGLMLKHEPGDDGDKLIDAAHNMAEMVDHIEELRRAITPFAMAAVRSRKTANAESTKIISLDIDMNSLEQAWTALRRK